MSKLATAIRVERTNERVRRIFPYTKDISIKEGRRARNGDRPMGDPKNIPLSEAKPGDIVHLKPLTLSDARTGLGLYIYVGAFEVPTAWIDHITPRPLAMGDKVKSYGDVEGEIIFIELDEVVIRANDGGGLYVRELSELTDLERVNG